MWSKPAMLLSSAIKILSFMFLHESDSYKVRYYIFLALTRFCLVWRLAQNDQKKLFLFELNEFNFEFVAEGAHRYHLNNIKNILNYQSLPITTTEIDEFDGLDPWVQWLSIHLGLSRKIHGVTYLGEVYTTKRKVIWRQLAELADVKWLVWGVINTPIDSTIGSQAFVPDPWSNHGSVYPR